MSTYNLCMCRLVQVWIYVHMKIYISFPIQQNPCTWQKALCDCLQRLSRAHSMTPLQAQLHTYIDICMHMSVSAYLATVAMPQILLCRPLYAYIYIDTFVQLDINTYVFIYTYVLACLWICIICSWTVTQFMLEHQITITTCIYSAIYLPIHMYMRPHTYANSYAYIQYICTYLQLYLQFSIHFNVHLRGHLRKNYAYFHLTAQSNHHLMKTLNQQLKYNTIIATCQL